MRKIVFDFKGIEQEPVQNDGEKKQVVQRDSTEEMFEYINSVMENESYGIGLHSTQGDNAKGTLESIMKNGLEIEERKKILSTVSSFGTHTKINQDHLKQRIMQYSYGKPGETKQNVIVLVPLIISNSQGQQIYLGFPPFDIECHGNDFRTSCVLDTVCTGEEEKGKIPPEFILGYYTSNNEGVTFIKNPSYFKFLAKEQKDEFFEKIHGRLQGKYKQISDAVISEDIQTLEMMSQKEQAEIVEKVKEGTRNNILERGVNSQLAETLSRSSVKIRQDDSATQALGYVERKRDKEQPIMQNVRNARRKILFDSYAGLKTSDLMGAKEILREGIEPLERTYEGKEI